MCEQQKHCHTAANKQYLIAGATIYRVSQVCNNDIKGALALLQLSFGIIIDQLQLWIRKSFLICFQVQVAEVADVLLGQQQYSEQCIAA